MDRMEMLKQITALDFVVVDLNLYLNTHPTDREAITKFNQTVMQVKALKQNYERLYGMLTSQDSCSAYPWQWLSQPWPWQYEANFKL